MDYIIDYINVVNMQKECVGKSQNASVVSQQ